MKPLLRSEGFYPGRHIKVSSGDLVYFGDRRRVVKHGDAWCSAGSSGFGEWVQVDLGKTIGLPSDCNRTSMELSSD